MGPIAWAVTKLGVVSGLSLPGSPTAVEFRASRFYRVNFIGTGVTMLNICVYFGLLILWLSLAYHQYRYSFLEQIFVYSDCK